jgi:drug/metabolite transporter (DMT)-like permease
MFLVFLLYSVFATSFWLIKESLVYADPMFLTFFRGVLSGFILLIIYLFSKRDQYKFTSKDWVILLIGSFCFSFLPNFLCGIALQHISSIKCALYYTFAPFVTAFVAYFFLNEKMTLKKVIGLSVGVAGIIPILIFEGNKAGSSSLLSFSMYDLLMVVTVACYAVGWIIIKPMVAEERHSPFLINGFIMLLGGMLAFGSSFFFPMATPEKMNLLMPWVLALTFANNIFSYTLYMYLLKFYSPVFISFAGFLEYLFAIFYGWLFLGEAVGYAMIVSALLICLGLYIFYQEELKEETMLF